MVAINSFWLRENTIAVEPSAHALTIIPAGAIVDVVGEADPLPDRLEVVWADRRLVLRRDLLHGERLPALKM